MRLFTSILALAAVILGGCGVTHTHHRHYVTSPGTYAAPKDLVDWAQGVPGADRRCHSREAFVDSYDNGYYRGQRSETHEHAGSSRGENYYGSGCSSTYGRGRW